VKSSGTGHNITGSVDATKAKGIVELVQDVSSHSVFAIPASITGSSLGKAKVVSVFVIVGDSSVDARAAVGYCESSVGISISISIGIGIGIGLCTSLATASSSVFAFVATTDGEAGKANSYILQFTFRRAVSCVLHRPPSQVIHCTMLYLKCLKPYRQLWN
jgi:hypothetical protein